ncbi:hypothetical protein AB1Z82_001120 [Bacillus cereus]
MENIPLIEKTFDVPLIWAQKIEYYRNGELVKRYSKNCEVVKIGEPVGPFLTGAEAGRAVGISKLTSIPVSYEKSLILNGFDFYSDGKQEVTFHMPNVRYAKENNLLQQAKPMTVEVMMDNMKLCGFNVVSHDEYYGAHTKFTTKCCNVDCDNTTKKQYNTFVSEERLPLCSSCSALIGARNKKRPIVAFKDSERIEFESVARAGKHLNIAQQTVYNLVKNGNTHSSGYRFEFLD